MLEKTYEGVFALEEEGFDETILPPESTDASEDSKSSEPCFEGTTH